MKYSLVFLGLAFIVFGSSSLSAQNPERDAALKQFRTGNNPEAITAFEALLKKKENASDAEVMNLRGLAYQNTGDVKQSRKMFEKAVKLKPESPIYRSNLAYTYLLTRQLSKSLEQAKKALELDPKSVNAYFVLGTTDLWEGNKESALATAERMLSLDPKSSAAYLLKADALIAVLGAKVAAGSTFRAEVDLLRQTVETLETGIKNSSAPSGMAEKLEAIRGFYDHFNKPMTASTNPPTPEPGVTPIKILSKPNANYSDAARSSGVQGTVRLAVMLGANGKVLHIFKVKGLGYGLDEQSFSAARRIKFTPKMKDGVPVSTVVTIDYSFSIR